MAEKINGILIWQGEGKKRRRLLKWEKKDGTMTMPNIFGPEQLDKELDGSQETEIPVELELEGGRPVRIRPVGKDWQGKVPAPKPLQKADYKQQAYDKSNAQTFQRKQQNGGTEMTGEFHNPYNFVPAVPREEVNELRDANGEKHDLADRPPAGHDRFLADKLSGKLCVKMTVETPLLLPDTTRVEVGEKEHKSFPVRVGADGKPEINPTAVKGMLRAAYEAITNSRLSVFKDHDERLAFRMDAKEGLQSVPALVRLVNGGAEITLLTGTVEANKIESNGKPLPGEPMYAAWLLSYGDFGTYRGTHGKHGEKVWAYIVPCEHKRFSFWNVEKLEDGSLPEPQSPPAFLQPSAKGPKNQWVQGYVCITNKNIENKHDERVFFNKSKSPIPPILVTGNEWKRLQSEWKRLIEDYAETDHSGKPDGVELSRHILNTDKERELKNETLCYARVERVRKNENSWQIKELIPVMISRRLHEVSPERLLPDCLKPVSLIEEVNDKGTTIHFSEMSPADRVFGCVRQKRKNQKGEDQEFKGNIAAYRGQIRIGAINCISNKADAIEDFIQSVPLQILGQPKPQQGRFYVAKDKDGNAQKNNEQDLTNEQAGYNKETVKGLRGRKVYPHHAKTLDIKDERGLPIYWDDYRQAVMPNGLYREFRRPNDVRDNQNRSVKGWVKPKTEFTFDIHFINLSEVELGALIWLLSLENGFHRFGGGKPLGFGSVKLELNRSEVFTGEELRKRYFALDEEDIVDKPKPTDAQTCLKAFEEAVKAYPNGNGQRIIESFLTSARGFNKPIHYPRQTTEPYRVENGKEVSASFNWFVANNSKDGLKLSLPNLHEENGLPLNPKK